MRFTGRTIHFIRNLLQAGTTEFPMNWTGSEPDVYDRIEETLHWHQKIRCNGSSSPQMTER